MIHPGFDPDTLLIGPGPGGLGGDPPRPAPTDPAEEYATAYGHGSFLTPISWEQYDGFWCRHPHEDYRRMMRDETVASSLKALKAATLSGGLRLMPAVRPDADGDGEVDPDAEKAGRVLEECLRSQRRLEFSTPVVPLLWEMLDAIGECNKLAEVVLEDDPDEADLYRIARIKVKPRWSYRFGVDDALNVTAIKVFTDRDEWRWLDPGKFVWLSWDPRDGDPRGTSVLDEAHHAWTMLVKLWPYALDGWETFGEAIMYGEVGPNEPMVPPRDKDGNVVPGKPAMTPQKAMSLQMTKLRGGAKVAGSNGSKIHVVESTRDNVTMTNAIGLLRGRIIRTILLQERATTEAKHGSKADSETGMDVMVTLVRYVREVVCATYRRMLRVMVAVNHGEADADRFTPDVSLGELDPRDFVAFCQAAGVLHQSGYLAEEQLPEMDQKLGLRPRRPGAKRVGPQLDSADAPADGPKPAPAPAPPENGGAP